jgi:hypothetical protein
LNQKFAVGSNVTEYSRDNTSYQKRQKIASKSSGSCEYISRTAKTVGSERQVKLKDQEKFIMETIKIRRETGNPVSKADAYMFLIKECCSDSDGDISGFDKAMGLSTGFIQPNFSSWLKRVLERNKFSVRKESISQSVPLNWLYFAISSAGIIRSEMKQACVTRLVNAVEMILNFYPKESTVIAPTNVKRVGCNRKEDEKQGCTIIRDVYFFMSCSFCGDDRGT